MKKKKKSNNIQNFMFLVVFISVVFKISLTRTETKYFRSEKYGNMEFKRERETSYPHIYKECLVT